MAYEADGNVVGFLLQSKGEIPAIFRRKRRNAELNARQIDAFVLAEYAAVHDFADDFLAAHFFNPQLDQSIRQQDAIAAMHFAGKRTKGGADAIGITRNPRGGDDEALPRA